MSPWDPSVKCIYLTLTISYGDRVTIDEIEAFVSIARLGGFARAASVACPRYRLDQVHLEGDGVRFR